jgi:hypothetical protein
MLGFALAQPNLPGSSMSPNAKIIGVSGALGIALSGCLFASSYTYTLRINNKLTAMIAICNDSNGDDCSDAINAGGSKEYVYISKGRKSSDEEKYKVFDREVIKICNKRIDFKYIQSVSPIVKRDDDHFEITIDRRISASLCE